MIYPTLVNHTGQLHHQLNKMGTTHNIVPNTDNDGLLGKPGKRWAEGHFATALTVDNANVVLDAPNDGRNYIRKNEAWAELQSDAYVIPEVTTSDASVTFIPFGPIAPPAIVAGQLMIFQANIAAINQLDGSSAAWTLNGVLQSGFDGNLSISTEAPIQVSTTYWSSGILVGAAINYDTASVKLKIAGIAGTPILWQTSIGVNFSQVATSSFVNFGCTDDSCTNYASSATADNQTCVYPAQQTSAMFVDIQTNNVINSLSVSVTHQNSSLVPAFSPTVKDYYIQASTTDWTTVFYSLTVNGEVYNGNTLVNNVIRVIGYDSEYYIRIIPVSLGLPSISTAPQAGYIPGYYLTTNDIFGSSGNQYCSIYDQNGFPVWYAQTDAFLNWSLQPGKEPNRVLTNAVGDQHHYALKLKYSSLGSSSPITLKPTLRDGLVFDIDPHEFIEVNTPYNRNGNLILAGYCPNASYGGFYIQEQNASGAVVWEWFSADYFNATLNSAANAAFNHFNSPEAYHMNSIDVDPHTGNLLVSMRACSAVICIEYTTGKVLWGFGGSVQASQFGFPIQTMAIPSSTANTKWLIFTNEPSVSTTLTDGTVVTNQYNGTAAQHDVRFRDSIIAPLTPGNHVISLYDNQSTDQAPQTASPQPTYPNTTTPTPRSRACVFEIDLVNNHIIHRSSIFSTAPWAGYRKSSFMGSYTIMAQQDASGNCVYTHSVNFTNEHPNFKEYIGPIDGTKTEVFEFDMPGVLYRIIKVPVTFFKRENLRASWTTNTTPPTQAVQQPFTPIPLETGLQAYWSLSDSTWVDSTTNAYNLTMHGSVTNGTGKITGDAVFSNSNYLTSTLDVTGYSAISVSAWVKTSSLPSTHFLGNWASTGVLFYGNGGYPNFYVNGVNAHGSSNVADGNWHHWVGTYDGTNINLYIDGALAGTQTLSGSIVNCSQGFGLGNAFFSSYLNGELDEVGVWNRALAAYEVEILYGDGAAMAYPFIPTGGLRLWLDANDSTKVASADGVYVDVWRDKSGNGKDAVPFPGTTKPTVGPIPALGNKKAVYFNNTPGNSEILVTDPIYSVGYSQLSSGTIIGVASAATNAISSGDTGCRWVDMIASNEQSSMGLLVKHLGVAAPVWGGFISESFVAEKPLLNYASVQASLLAAQQQASGQTVTQFPTLLTSTAVGAVSIVVNTGASGSTAIPSSALGLPNSQFISSYFYNGTIKSIVGDNVTFYGQVADQPTNNGISIGASIVAQNAIGLRSVINVAEVMIYDRVLSAQEIAKVVSYLRAKYSI